MKLSSKVLPLLAMLMAGAFNMAQSEEYPTRMITIVVPFSAGAISDSVARVVAEKMRLGLGQSVIVENKPSVGGMVGAADVAKAKPDGYRILLSSNSINSINASLFKQLPYNPEKDFAPISMAGEIPAVLISRADLPVSNLRDVINLAKSKPGAISFASGNTTGQIAGEALKSAAGIDLNNVPYKSEPLGMTDVLSGQVDLMFLNLPVAYSQIRAGKIKAIAFTGRDRVAVLPDVQRANETVPSYTMPNGWLAFFAPAGTPKPIIDRLNKEIVSALRHPEVKAKLEATGGYMVDSSTPDELAARVQKDSERWAELIKGAKISQQ